MKKILLLVGITVLMSCNSQEEKKKIETISVSNSSLEHVEPPNWWIGFKDSNLQLLVKDENIGGFTPKIDYQGVHIKEVHTAKSPNYLFLDISISDQAKPGKFDIVFKNEKGEERKHTYELKARSKSSEAYKGFDSSDAIFLVTPDRFANGDSSNDIIEGLKETKIDRTHGYARHGGDIQGIEAHLDYISDLGYTAVWPTPLLMNDMPESSYHGYAITDYYKVDPRFGNLEDYIRLSDRVQVKGMKLIMDQVANHCGLEHWWMKDLPFEDWVNDQENYESNIENWDYKVTKVSNHRRTTNQDLYASKEDREGMTNGWFVSDMPDLNQRNSFLAKYIIQNSIWWIETLDLGGIRQDTYPYPDKEFMSDWAGAIMTEYPNFSIVGEEWSHNPLLVAYWQSGNNNRDGYESNLKSTMDFPMLKAMVDGVNEEESWDKGLVKIYEGLANDFSYVSPKDIMVFLDNHDKSRIYTQVGQDITKTKMALGYMLCLPRIPQIYYGTEILMDDSENPGDHGLIRTDFPGGWKGDAVNAFTGEGLTADQKEMQSFLKSILNYRKSSKAIQNGKTVHFAPENGVYVLFRTLEDETVVLILNKNDKPISLDLKRFDEIGLDGKTLKNVISKTEVLWNSTVELETKGVTILTTKK